MKRLGVLILGAVPLWADLPLEIVTTPPESVNLQVRKDAIGVWMMSFPETAPSNPDRVYLRSYVKRGDSFRLEGLYPLRRVRTVSVFGFLCSDENLHSYVCANRSVYRMIITARQGSWIQVVVDVVNDKRIWVRIPSEATIAWLDLLGTYPYPLAAYGYVIPGFFERKPFALDRPDWDGKRLPFGLSLTEEKTVHMDSWVFLIPEGRAGNFLRVSRTYEMGETLYVHIVNDGRGQERVTLDFPGYDEQGQPLEKTSPDTVWVPIRDREGALLIWFGDITD